MEAVDGSMYRTFVVPQYTGTSTEFPLSRKVNGPTTPSHSRIQPANDSVAATAAHILCTGWCAGGCMSVCRYSIVGTSQTKQTHKKNDNTSCSDSDDPFSQPPQRRPASTRPRPQAAAVAASILDGLTVGFYIDHELYVKVTRFTQANLSIRIRARQMTDIYWAASTTATTHAGYVH